MYRQFLIDSRDTITIVWQPTHGEPITDYHLLTVIYGTAAAPFLALQVLDQFVDNKGAEFPLSSRSTSY